MDLIVCIIVILGNELRVVSGVTLPPLNGNNVHNFLGSAEERSNIQHIPPENDQQQHHHHHHYCNYEFSKQTFGVLSSPGYPSWYPSNITCRWRIVMKADTRVVMTIREFFLGSGDELSIDNGKSIKLYSLQKPPTNILFSSSSKVTVTLKSSLTSSNSNNITFQKPRLFYALFEQEGCGGTLVEESGYINVPLYIHGTKRPHECVWTVNGTRNKVVQLDFVQFDMEPGSCVYNNVYVRDGDQNAGYVLGDFCEENPPFSKLRTITSKMTIAYRTRPNLFGNKPLMLPNIKMYYEIVDNCGGDLEGYSGSLASPSRWLDDRSSCDWYITVPESKIILLKFSDWNVRRGLRAAQQRHDEEVMVLDREGENSTSVMWKSKGDINPPDSVIISNNRGMVRLVTNKNHTSKAVLHFKAFYEAIVPLATSCFQIADKKFFMCTDETYVECWKRCDGITDCQSGNDEMDCPSQGRKRTIGHTVVRKQQQQLQINKPKGWASYAILWFAAVAVSAILIVVLVIGDRVLRKLQQSKAVNVQPPPYKKFQQGGGGRSVSVIPKPPLPSVAPPPYEFSESSTSGAYASVSSELISRTRSVPFNLDSSSSNGSSESVFRPRHSTPFCLFGSNYTLGSSSDSIQRGRYSSTDGSSESISRSTHHRNTLTTAALFHDTDILDSTRSTISNTRAQLFRFSDTQDDHEEFLRQIQFKEDDVN